MQTHDKYKFVGHLVDDPINEILEHIEEEDTSAATEPARETEEMEQTEMEQSAESSSEYVTE